jgi:transcriptional regulator with XRE-family HTH domain
MEGEGLEGLEAALGTALRDARNVQGLSLRKLAVRSDGRFKPSAVGGYERGERSISVDRFVELALAIGVAPQEVLGDALEHLAPRAGELTVRLTELGKIPSEVAALVGELAERIKLARGDYFADVVTLRTGDLQVISGGTQITSVLKEIEPALVPAPADRSHQPSS